MSIKKKIALICALLIILVGLFMLLFPVISSYINNTIANNNANIFENKVFNVVDGSYREYVLKGKINEQGYPIDVEGNKTSDSPLVFKEDLEKLYQDSVIYNEKLKTNQIEHLLTVEDYEKPALDLTNYGIFDNIYGYIECPGINLKLPVYLGADNNNLSYGIGHMSGTSLPIGGSSTNTALAGHTGYIGRTFFDNLRNLKLGDTVKIHNYFETLEYKVIDYYVVSPDNSESIFIKQDKSLLTLVTCTSEAIGETNRYIVVCESTD